MAGPRPAAVSGAMFAKTCTYYSAMALDFVLTRPKEKSNEGIIRGWLKFT
jgi:hypothetical protein